MGPKANLCGGRGHESTIFAPLHFFLLLLEKSMKQIIQMLLLWSKIELKRGKYQSMQFEENNKYPSHCTPDYKD